jgi:hypothetical protein
MRRQELALNPLILAYGLSRYSVRGVGYVEDVQDIITQNRLRQRDERYFDYAAG